MALYNNLLRMPAFYRAYPVIGAKVPQAVALLPELTRVRQFGIANIEQLGRRTVLEAELSNLKSDTVGVEGMQP